MAVRHGLVRYNLWHLLIPGLILGVLAAYDVWFLTFVDSGRRFDDYISDVRRINDYCNWYLGLTAIMIGLLAGRLSEVRQAVGLVPVSPFAVALLAASVNMLFFPVPYRQSLLWPVQLLWLYHVVFEQAVVIFTAYGLVIIMIGAWRGFIVLERKSQIGTPGEDRGE